MHVHMDVQIHHLEQEAYSYVLRAFLAQSDSISWEKLELMTHLRRELRVSDSEHKELYGNVKDDEIIQRIKEWRQGESALSTPLSAHAPVYPSSVLAAFKKQKTFGPSFPSHTSSLGLVSKSQSATKQGRGRGRKQKSVLPFQSFSPNTYFQQPQTIPIVNGQLAQHNSFSEPMENEPCGVTTSVDPLIGRKVCMRWPGDNSFYEALITDYNPSEGRHALLYDANTVNETSEWVDLKEVSPEDIRWLGEDPGISHGLRRTEFPSLQNGTKKVSADIDIVHTDTLIKQVESILHPSNPDPLKVYKAEKMLKDHEEALVDALSKLADASDGESARWERNGGEMC